MPPTVKSLEDRIDVLVEDVATVKTQNAVLTAKVEILSNSMSAMQAQLQTVSTQLATIITGQSETTVRLDKVVEKLEAVAGDYSTFKAKSETTFALVRWIGIFTATAVLGMIATAFTVTRSAGNFEATIRQQERTLDLQQKTLDEIRRDVADLKTKFK